MINFALGQIGIIVSHYKCKVHNQHKKTKLGTLDYEILCKPVTILKQQFFRLVQIGGKKCRQKSNLKTEILFGIVRKNCGKRRKCCIAAFSPFLTNFQKGVFFQDH